MTLQKFTTLAARVSDAMLRPAIVAALAKGAPRTAKEFSGFHDDVIDELRGAAHRADPTATAVEPAE